MILPHKIVFPQVNYKHIMHNQNHLCWKKKHILSLNVPIPDKKKKLTENFFSHFFVVPQKVLWRPLEPS